MFRRRSFRPRGRFLAPMPHPMLQRANELMAIEDFTGAARAFEELAQSAHSRGGPAAPHLYLQAGRASLLGGNMARGIALARQGLSLFAERGEWLKFRRNRRQFLGDLQRLGFSAQAQEFGDFLSGQIPAEAQGSIDQVEPAARSKAHLPARCGDCGAPLRSDAVEWIDDQSAECPYCGSVARVE